MIRFVNITQDEFLKHRILYKHLPLENALRTLKDKSLWFANPATWKDPFEKRFLEAKYMMKDSEVKFRWKGRVFCTCLTQTITSEAFWNTYSRNEIGIELRLYRKALLEELARYEDIYKIFIGKVEYLKTDEIKRGLRSIPFNPPVRKGENLNTDDFAARLFLLKRTAFSYEDEIRIIIVKENTTKETGINFSYNCENTNLIQRIIVDPRVGDYTYNMLKELFVNTYGFSPLEKDGKMRNRVLRSQLYSKQPQVTLKLD